LSDDDEDRLEAEEPPPEPNVCEECGSSDVARRQKAVAFVVIGAFVMAIGITQDASLPAFFLVGALAIWAIVAATWRCRQCGHTW